MSRRYDIEAVLRPDSQLTRTPIDLFIDLAVTHKWHIESADEFGAVVSRRCIRSPQWTTEGHVASGFHEGGHLEDQQQHDDAFVYDTVSGKRIHVSLTGELEAWQYALKRLGSRGLWTRAMQQEMVTCLRSYWPLVVKTCADDERIDAVIAEGDRRARGVVVVKIR